MSGKGSPGKIGKVETGNHTSSEKFAYSDGPVFFNCSYIFEHFSSILKELIKKNLKCNLIKNPPIVAVLLSRITQAFIEHFSNILKAF
jgi:hypothetical protein